MSKSKMSKLSSVQRAVSLRSAVTKAATKHVAHLHIEELVCHFTLELPVNPVIASDGYVYEKEAWRKYRKTKKRNNERLTHGPCTV